MCTPISALASPANEYVVCQDWEEVAGAHGIPTTAELNAAFEFFVPYVFSSCLPFLMLQHNGASMNHVR